MSTPIDDSKTLTASGGADPAYSATVGLNTNTAKVQVQVGGATTDVDIFIEGRLDVDMGWATLHSAATVANGYNNIWPVDTDDIYELRVRAVNADGINAGSVSVVLRTS